MQVLDDAYHATYQRDSVSEQALHAYDEIADELVKAFKPETALDVGCGGGALIRGLMKRGVSAWGVEGSSHAVSLMPGQIWHLDLRKPVKDAIYHFYAFDLVTCFDVAEHIEEECADVFMDSLVHWARNTVCFGAAPLGQDGCGHVNLQPYEYWHAKFADRGFALDIASTRKVKEAIEARDHNFIWWVAKNAHVYRRRGT